MVKQAAADQADINKLMAKWLVTRGPLPGTGEAPRYGDFSGLGDYRELVERVRSAEEEFQALPAAVRDRCRNDPGEFLAILYSAERTEEFKELLALGLEEKRLPMSVRLTDEQVSDLAQAVAGAGVEGGTEGTPQAEKSAPERSSKA